MQKLKPLPRSKAKTAWNLMLDVRRAIKKEPKRANMRVAFEERHPKDGGPACGSVGCIAGWICALLNRKEFFGRIGIARSVLGPRINYYTAGDGWDVFNSGSGDSCALTRPGTKAHANAVISRIDKFMKINKKALKARKIRKA